MSCVFCYVIWNCVFPCEIIKLLLLSSKNNQTLAHLKDITLQNFNFWKHSRKQNMGDHTQHVRGWSSYDKTSRDNSLQHFFFFSVGLSSLSTFVPVFFFFNGCPFSKNQRTIIQSQLCSLASFFHSHALNCIFGKMTYVMECISI